jgi:hypothetical protein
VPRGTVDAFYMARFMRPCGPCGLRPWCTLLRHNPYHATFLYDGQNGQILAIATIKNGQRSGMVFSFSLDKRTDDNGFGFAVEYICSKMDDDRKQRAA